jgi:hypothetical protein
MPSARSGRMAVRFLSATCFVLSSLLMSSIVCYGAGVVFIGASDGSPKQQQELEIATRFYGLDLKIVTSVTDGDYGALSRAVEAEATVAVVIAADALALVREKDLLRALNRRPVGNLPLLILGVTPETDETLLGTWSNGAAIACRRVDGLRRPRYFIPGSGGFVRQLTSFQVSFQANDAFYFVLGENSQAQEITQIRDDPRAYPIFIKSILHRQEVFLDCTEVSSARAVGERNSEPMLNAFARIAPVMMFIRHCAGERGWHPIHHYANLTIDDPWLREPYGSLEYRELLAQMERHNFHSTIAFIPWNYDRSERDVVSLIRDHPDRFSISVHGDNHDHKEFTDYRSKSLALQIEDLKQSLARMNRFQALTGIPYDKVMVFPHSIAPERTLEALKRYNYLATINSSNVPMDRRSPTQFPFALRAVTVSFADFASITRYPAGMPLSSSFIAVNEFLENPLLLYCHHDYFARGADAFDVVADQVNRLEPDTHWRGLGDIVRHLYLIRLREDANYDVLGFASTICLENVSTRDSIFFVRKQEIERPAAVTVDRQSWPYLIHDGYLEMRIPVASGQSRTISIVYGNVLDSATIGIEKRSFRVYCLRMASDFRDITLARYAWGRRLIQLYNEHDGPLTLVLVCFFAVVASCILGIWRLRVMINARAVRRATSLLTP